MTTCRVSTWCTPTPRTTPGVQDEAYLFDSAGADQFGAGPGWAYFTGAGFYNFASQFDVVYGYSSSTEPCRGAGSGVPV